MTTQEAKKVFIETLGCQMNFNDSEVMLGLLQSEGFQQVETQQEADLLIVNTCQIRGSAEDKAYSHLGRLGKLKARNPKMKIAMAGCIAQQAKETVFKRAPYVDIVFGTQNIHELPDLVRKAFDGQQHVLAVDRQKARSTYDYLTDITPVRESDLSAWLTIIEGCDYFCTYCVVPYTRGRQISREPESILREALHLASHGFKEVTLLGQTVDSYGKDFKEKQYDLADLMREISEINGIERIRFMTSHPLDLNDRIIEAIATLPKVMEYIHIPMQAGDDTVLSRMKRGYTSQQYYDLVHKIQTRIPEVAISGDYIVGFPGETDEQFQHTVNSVSLGDIHMANTAIYSPRQQTPAAIWEERGEEVPQSVKEERLQILIEAIRQQSLKKNQELLNQDVEILIEGPSKRNPHRLTGRTRQNKVVNIDFLNGSEFRDKNEITAINQEVISLNPEDWIGKLTTVRITEAQPFSLLGVFTTAD